MTKVMLATPMYGGACYGFYAQSVFQLADAFRSRGIPMQYSFMFNESLINRARNAMSKLFLKSDCTHLLFIDADIRFRPMDIMGMLDADVDLIGGIYPKKEINWQQVEKAVKAGVPAADLKHHTGSFVINLLDGNTSATVPVDKPFEVLYVGTGCMLIKRAVFERLEPVTPTYTNDVLDLANNLTGEKIHNFFDVPICPESNRLLSEDFAFCKAWRGIGGKIHAAPWAQLAHIGSYAFEGALMQ